MHRLHYNLNVAPQCMRFWYALFRLLVQPVCTSKVCTKVFAGIGVLLFLLLGISMST